jgi:hypothetical protein
VSTRAAVIAGVALGVLYTLSPISTLAIPAAAWMVWRASRDLGPEERRWFLWLTGLAMVVRLLLVAGLFLSADADRPFATFFGDEELFKSRPIWIRNIGLGVPISAADWIYAFDDTGRSGYLFALAILQAVFGEAPYSIHVLNAVIYLGGVLLLFRLARATFGRVAAMGGLAVLLFLPSLFAWSISALKEPMYTLAAAVELLLVIAVVRAPGVARKAAALAGVVALAFVLESLRKGGMQVAALGAVAGMAGGFIVPRPRLLLASAIVAPIAVVAILNVEPVQARVLSVVRDSVRYHAGHVLTVGHTYELVNGWYYYDWPAIFRIGPGEAVQYVSRAVIHYLVEPLPWVERSAAMLAYVPEQAFWLTLLVLLPFGVAAGLKADALVTSTLLAHAAAVAMMVALTSGNVGTLIRHRGLVLPYLVWLSVLGLVVVIHHIGAQRFTLPESGSAHGNR